LGRSLLARPKEQGSAELHAELGRLSEALEECRRLHQETEQRLDATEANLAQVGQHTRFITRLPASYHEHGRVILEAVDAAQWQTIGRIAQTPATKNDTPRISVAIEKNFSFLKDDQIVNALFLKRPERIEALGLILLISLLLWRLIEQ